MSTIVGVIFSPCLRIEHQPESSAETFQQWQRSRLNVRLRVKQPQNATPERRILGGETLKRCNMAAIK